MRRQYLMGIGSAILALMQTGCGTGSNGPAPIVNPPTPQAQIQEIQNNPNMPPQAKAAALGAIEARQKPVNTMPKPAGG
jgi:hypothetical protein